MILVARDQRLWDVIARQGNPPGLEQVRSARKLLDDRRIEEILGIRRASSYQETLSTSVPSAS